ncbi:hypothetical protein AAG906_017133 [Vitis piasezkii]
MDSRYLAAPPQDSAQYDSTAPPPPPLSYQTDATPLLVVSPIQESDDEHARMDRLEQRMKQMRVSNGAINWNDFDGALVASLPAQFRMLEIERTWDDLTQEFLRQFAFNTIIDISRRELEALRQRPEGSLVQAHDGIEEGIAKGLWHESSLTTQMGRSPQEDRDTEIACFCYIGLKETSYLIPLALSPTDCYSSCTELASRLIPQPVPPQFKMDLHCAYHQDQGLVNLGQPSVTMNPLPGHSRHAVDTVGSQTSIPSSLISDWVPFEIMNHSGRVAQPPPLVARPFDGVVSHEEVRRKDDKILWQLLSTQTRISIWSLLASSSAHRNSLIRALTQIRVETTTTLEGLIHIMTVDRATCHKVPSVLLDNGWALNVCPLSTTIALSYAPSEFDHHSEDDLFLTGFTFDEVQTLEVGDFCRDLVAMSFDQHSSTVVLNMMREANYRYMVHLHQERVRARLTCTPFDYPVRPYRMSLVDYFGESRPILIWWDFDVVTNIKEVDELYQLLISCFLEETTDCGVDVEPIGVTDGVVPCDEYRIEMDMMILALELMEDVTVGDDEFEDTFGFIKGASDFVDPPLLFDFLLGFISCSDDVYDSVSMDFRSYLDVLHGLMRTCSLILYSPTPSPILPHVGPLSRGDCTHVGWLDNVVLVPKKDGKVRVCVDFRDLNKASPKDDFLLPHIDLLVDSTIGHLMLSFMDGFFGIIRFDGSRGYEEDNLHYRVGMRSYLSRVTTTLFHDMMHRNVEVYVDDMIVKSEWIT